MTGDADSRSSQRGERASRRSARLAKLRRQPWFSRQTPRKQQTYLALEDPLLAHRLGRFCGIGLFVLIVANAFLLESFSSSLGGVLSVAMRVFSIFSTVVFAGEYFCRLWVADMLYPELPAGRARVRYALSLMGIIDLLAFLPSMLMWVVPFSPGLADAVRIIRLVRLIKISRYMRGLRTIGLVLKKRRHEIVAAFMVLALLTIASSVLMYEAEHAVQPDKFDSVFTGIYWAMTTITTTGYGDLVPVTPLGRFVGFVTMVLAIAAIAIPSGIFSAGFVEAFRSQRLEGADADDDFGGKTAEAIENIISKD